MKRTLIVASVLLLSCSLAYAQGSGGSGGALSGSGGHPSNGETSVSGGCSCQMDGSVSGSGILLAVLAFALGAVRRARRGSGGPRRVVDP